MPPHQFEKGFYLVESGALRYNLVLLMPLDETIFNQFREVNVVFLDGFPVYPGDLQLSRHELLEECLVGFH